MKKQHEILLVGALMALLFVLYGFLASAGQTVYASPDESAIAVVATQIAQNGRAFLSSSLSTAFPWAHPRSWISAGDKLAPVGFLGWPWVLSLFCRLAGVGILRWIGALLLASAAWPFFWILRRKFDFWAAWWGTAVAFTVPSVILYGNRGLFPNGAVVALGLWVMWLLFSLRDKPRPLWFFGLTGTVIALAGAIRPVELLWLLPWWMWAGSGLRPNKKQGLAGVLGASLILLPIFWLAFRAYGSFLEFGYLLHDNPVPSASHYSLPIVATISTTHYSLPFLPYGFHPRTIWWNVHSFLGWFLFPWMVLAALALWLLSRERKKLNTPVLLSAWTLFVLLAIYGSGRFADHVRPDAVTIGNSFLRYLLPLAPMFGWALAYVYHQVSGRRGHRILLVIGAILLIGLGVQKAFWGDDEALIFTRRELMRYVEIRQASHAWFASGDVILSDRSDKIFFPDFQAVSPVPSMDEVSRLVHETGTHIGLFSRPLSQAQKDTWLAAGVEAQELASFSRERLYRLAPRSNP